MHVSMHITYINMYIHCHTLYTHLILEGCPPLAAFAVQILFKGPLKFEHPFPPMFLTLIF